MAFLLAMRGARRAGSQDRAQECRERRPTQAVTVALAVAVLRVLLEWRFNTGMLQADSDASDPDSSFF